MKQQRKKHSPEFKANETLESIKGVKSVSQIAREFEIHPVMLSNWEKKMFGHLPDVFDKNRFRKQMKT